MRSALAAGALCALPGTAAVYAGGEILRERAVRLMQAWMALCGAVEIQRPWLLRPYSRETEVFIRPVGERGSALTAFGNLLVSGPTACCDRSVGRWRPRRARRAAAPCATPCGPVPARAYCRSQWLRSVT